MQTMGWSTFARFDGSYRRAMPKEETFQDLSLSLALWQAGPLALALHRIARRHPRRTFEARRSHALHTQPRASSTRSRAEPWS